MQFYVPQRANQTADNIMMDHAGKDAMVDLIYRPRGPEGERHVDSGRQHASLINNGHITSVKLKVKYVRIDHLSNSYSKQD